MCKTTYRTGDLLWDNENKVVYESNGSNKLQGGCNVATDIPLTDDLIKELFNVISESASCIELSQGLILGKEVIGFSFNNKKIMHLHELQHVLDDNNIHINVDKEKLRRYLSANNNSL